MTAAVENPPPGIVRGPVQEERLASHCPLCGRANLVSRSVPLDLPYFGEAFQTTLRCEDCGYRHADLLLTRTREPRRVSLRVTHPDRLNARVARSASCTVRILELGARMDPGPRSEAFVSNVEGLLHRFPEVALGAKALASSKRARADAARAVARLDGCIEARRPFTLVLEDPTGNSDVFHVDAMRKGLTPEEVAHLRAPEPAINLRDLRTREPQPDG